jgi:uncharacterized protein
MRTTTAAILGISFIIGAASLGTSFYRSRVREQTIHVVGAATRRFDSDVVKWRLSVGHSVGVNDQRGGYARTRDDFKILMEQLHTAGLTDKEITVQPINCSPIRDNSGNLTGYDVTQNIILISSGITTVEKLALSPDTIFARGIALTSSNLEYYFSKLAEIKKELLAEATKDAVQRAAEIAKNSRTRAGRIASVRSGIFQITEPYSTDVSDYGIYNTATRQKDVTVTVTADFALR